MAAGGILLLYFSRSLLGLGVAKSIVISLLALALLPLDPDLALLSEYRYSHVSLLGVPSKSQIICS
jgi:hypothetical protein